MQKTTIRISLDPALLKRIDALVRQRRFAGRSEAIESLLTKHVSHVRRTRLAEQCAQLEPAEERALAEAGIRADAAVWPAY
jgi:metal-responsive CopG/Arc/MetJ family transcriptional regulator